MNSPTQIQTERGIMADVDELRDALDDLDKINHLRALFRLPGRDVDLELANLSPGKDTFDGLTPSDLTAVLYALEGLASCLRYSGPSDNDIGAYPEEVDELIAEVSKHVPKMPTSAEQLRSLGSAIMNLLDAVAEIGCDMTDDEVMEKLGEIHGMAEQRLAVLEIIRRAVEKYGEKDD